MAQPRSTLGSLMAKEDSEDSDGPDLGSPVGGSLRVEAHAAYFRALLHEVPKHYISLETSRATLAYFCASALDLLGESDKLDAPRIVDWLYSLQLRPPQGGTAKSPDRAGGFRGAPQLGAPHCATGAPSTSEYDRAHLAMTYSALALLTILGDDLSRVDRKGTLAFVASMQDESGSFRASADSESDMRFLFCAAAVCELLDDRERVGMDVRRATACVLAARSYDGGFGLAAGQESHGGSTYTALAALSLMGTLHQLPRPERTVRWCVERQRGGFQGRPNKDEDSCYSFWIGASLELLGVPRMADGVRLQHFVGRCECVRKGGFGKFVGCHPDVLHSYYSLCGLSLIGASGVAPLDPCLGMSQRASGSRSRRPNHAHDPSPDAWK